MKRINLINHLLKMAACVSVAGLLGHQASASNNYFNLDTDPSTNVTSFRVSDITNTLPLVAAWNPTNGSTLEPGVGSQSTNGYIAITPTTTGFSSHGTRGAIVFNDLDAGVAPAQFTWSCDLRIGAGNTNPADGLSFSFARNGDAAITGTFPTTAWEQGTKTGLAVCLLAWPADNLVTGIPGLQVKVDGIVITNVAMTNLNSSCTDLGSVQTGPLTTNGIADLCWQPFSIVVNAAGQLTVSYKGSNYLSNVSVGSFAAGRFIIAGRTGGSWQEQDVDNITINTVPATVPTVGLAQATYFGFTFKIYDAGSAVTDPNSVTVTVDGTPVTLTGVASSGGVTTVAYQPGGAVYAANSSHTLNVSFSGTGFSGTVNSSSTFTVPLVSPTVGTVTGNPFGWKFNISDFVTTDGSILTPDTNTITVSMDGTPITLTRIVQSGLTTNTTVVVWDNHSPVMATGSRHTNVIQFSGSSFPLITKTNAFTVANSGELDVVHHYLGTFRGTNQPKLTASGGGHTGKLGDFGFDMGNPPTLDAKFGAQETDMLIDLAHAAAAENLTVSVWIKRRTIASSSDFWINSATAGNSGREFQLHGPYADNNFYFDTAGATTQPGGRLQAASSSFPPYAAVNNVSYWTNSWHHIVAIKNNDAKSVYVDGQLFMSQASGAFPLLPFASSINLLFVGGASPNNLPVNGILDDFAVYSTALSTNDITALYTGTAPNAVTASNSLLMWWDFNDTPAVSIGSTNGAQVINFNQVLQSSTNLSGPWTDLTNATSPFTNTPVGPQQFFRARKF